MFISSFYTKSPIWFQNVILSTRAVTKKLMREGREQSKLLKEIILHESDYTSNEFFSKERLNKTLLNAKKNVSFYRDNVKTELNGIDLSDFPLISKNEVRNFPHEFENNTLKCVAIKGATSGTTGTPLVIKQNMDSVIREQAFVARHLMWAGFKIGDRRAWIRGDMIVPFEQKRGPFWRYSWFENMIMLSSFHMSSSNLDGYIKAMVDYKVEIIQAYPSSIVTLAKFLEIKDRYYPGQLKSIVTSSESLSYEDKILVEKRFKCTVFDWYGLFERVAAISSCEHGRYHILTDYSHVELLDVGQGRHEIVGTNFNNDFFPLIRYCTGDHVYLSEEVSCPCGRVFPIIDRIDGRVGDYLLGEDGQKIHILNHIPKGVDGLLATQFIQDIKNEVKILVVVDPIVFNILQQEKLIKNVKDRLGETVLVFIEIVESIPRTPNGKVRQAICSI
ncbi:phenylacetate--CoA ligase family protein [Shewanella frigidimarina]|uniref:phenylacetate--CoA ligase family protein n=1 Tax=Shewanella frigidimarina TaxID=56812 RepID=UPI003D7BD6DC